jgi:hypothetical protein
MTKQEVITEVSSSGYAEVKSLHLFAGTDDGEDTHQPASVLRLAFGPSIAHIQHQ